MLASRVRSGEARSTPNAESNSTTYDDFSSLKVYDSRVSGADAAMVPDRFDWLC